MPKYIRHNVVKEGDEGMEAMLVAKGWKPVEQAAETVHSDLPELRAKAAALGLDFHHRTGAEKLQAMIEAAEAGK